MKSGMTKDGLSTLTMDLKAPYAATRTTTRTGGRWIKPRTLAMIVESVSQNSEVKIPGLTGVGVGVAISEPPSEDKRRTKNCPHSEHMIYQIFEFVK